MEDATSIVLTRIWATGWPEHDGEAQPWHINLGWCVDWARLVCARVSEAVMDEWDDPDSEMLHTFVIVNGRYYDSECLDGALRVQDLPSFARPWQDRPALPAGEVLADEPGARPEPRPRKRTPGAARATRSPSWRGPRGKGAGKMLT